jgi:hypothetical protein
VFKVRFAVAGIALLLFARSTQILGQAPTSSATLSGRVFDSDGNPLPGAKISVFPMDVAISGPMPGGAVTDEKGEYKLMMPAYPGRVRLCAVKESAGYPDTQGLLFASGKESMPEVTLRPGDHLTGVDIHLGPPDGVLEGLVVDSRTQMPVRGARINLHRNNPESMYSGTLPPDGHFRFALPPTPIEISVTAPGFLPWKYKDAENGGNELVLSTSERRTITVGLMPE